LKSQGLPKGWNVREATVDMSDLFSKIHLRFHKVLVVQGERLQSIFNASERLVMPVEFRSIRSTRCSGAVMRSSSVGPEGPPSPVPIFRPGHS
jgi:hypothetical protein